MDTTRRHSLGAVGTILIGSLAWTEVHGIFGMDRSLLDTRHFAAAFFQ